MVRVSIWDSKLHRHKPERAAHFKLLGCVLTTPIYWGLQRIFHIYFPHCWDWILFSAAISFQKSLEESVKACSSQNISRNYYLSSLIPEITFLERNKDEQTCEGSFSSSPGLFLFLTTKVSCVVVLCPDCSSSQGNIYERAPCHLNSLSNDDWIAKVIVTHSHELLQLHWDDWKVTRAFLAKGRLSGVTFETACCLHLLSKGGCWAFRFPL